MSEHTIIGIILVASLSTPVGMYVILKKPRLFFTMYLLLSTKMFGFMPMILGLHVKATMFFLHCAMILDVVVLLFMGWKFSDRIIILFLACVSGLIAFGILYPYFLGFSSISSAIVDGKDMFGYAVLAYLSIHSQRFDFDYFLKLFCFVGVVLTAVIIVGYISGYCPPSYYHIGGTRIITVNYTSYIALAACLVFLRMLRPYISIRSVFLFLFLIAGLLIQGHRSVFLATLLVISSLWLIRAHFTVKLRYIIIGLPLLLSLHLVSDGRYFETFVKEPILELRAPSYGAIASRKFINAVRLRYIEQRPLLGYGFIDETAPLGWPIAEQSGSRFDQSLGVVDSGYVDMMVRFGIVGTLTFFLVLGFVLFERLRNGRRLSIAQLAMLLFLATFLLVNYTWSVFTYEFGISCSCVAIFLLYHEKPLRRRLHPMAPCQEYV